MFEPRWGGTDNLDAHPNVSATYKGLATGWYARKTGNTITSDGESLEVVTNGMFTADVTLWAVAGDASERWMDALPASRKRDCQAGRLRSRMAVPRS